MRKLVVTEFVSLDGVFEDPGGAEGYVHGGWSMSYWSEQIGQFKTEELFEADALLLGRVTYEAFAAAWPGRQPEKPEDDPFTYRFNTMRKYVASTTLQKADWTNSTIISTDVADEVAKLKQRDGQNILIHGSGTLTQAMREAGLIDEYRLLVYPVILGSGKRLFGASRTNLKLIESKGFDSGVVAMRYEPA
jgi:dihydrofolate reductase